ncbi:MAG: polymer-forming cytoskeletal protein [Heliobacteriaceae bacterium]|nr:polymer-forming cytoskeletal protein [Heliobacteriaceae bacterium]
MKILKKLLALGIIAGILIGLGVVANNFYDFNLTVKPRAAGPVHPDLPANQPDSWLRIDAEKQPVQEDIVAPDQAILIAGPLPVRVEGKIVRIEPRSLVTGPVVAENVTILEATVRNHIQANTLFAGTTEEQAGIPMMEHFADRFPDNKTVIFGDLAAQDIRLGQTTQVYGKVGLPASRIDIAGQVSGQVTGEKIVLRSTAVIDGDVIASQGVATLEPGATVNGRLTDPEGKAVRLIRGWSTPHQWEREEKMSPAGPGPMPVPHSPVPFTESGPGLAILWLPVLAGIIGLVVMAYTFLAGEAQAGASNLKLRPWRCLWIGFLTFLISLPVAFILMITIIGIPLALALAVGIAAAIIVGFCGCSLIVGEKITPYLKQEFSPLVALIIGAVLIAHLIWVPVLGWLLFIAILVMGLGAVSLNWYPRLKDTWQQWRAKHRSPAPPSPPTPA